MDRVIFMALVALAWSALPLTKHPTANAGSVALAEDPEQAVTLHTAIKGTRLRFDEDDLATGGATRALAILLRADSIESAMIVDTVGGAGLEPTTISPPWLPVETCRLSHSLIDSVAAGKTFLDMDVSDLGAERSGGCGGLSNGYCNVPAPITGRASTASFPVPAPGMVLLMVLFALFGALGFRRSY